MLSEEAIPEKCLCGKGSDDAGRSGNHLPRQARYQAALRPDRVILHYFTEGLASENALSRSGGAAARSAAVSFSPCDTADSAGASPSYLPDTSGLLPRSPPP